MTPDVPENPKEMTLYIPENPKEMVLYDAFRWPEGIPTDVPFDELTPEQQQKILGQYRFSGYYPGIYQGITGVGDMP